MTKFSTVKIVWFAALLLLPLSTAKAQKPLPEKIRISKGHCTAPCGFEKGFHNLKFDNQLEFNRNNNSFYFRKQANKKCKSLPVKVPAIFSDSLTYLSLDSLFENFISFKVSPGKYYIYKIEMIYTESLTGLPSKTKTMEFYLTTNPEKNYPVWMEQLIDAYNAIVFKP